jgi:hypothetical protein
MAAPLQSNGAVRLVRQDGLPIILKGSRQLDWASKQCWKRGFSKSRMVQSASDTWETSACLIRASHLRLLRFQRYVRFEESISY